MTHLLKVHMFIESLGKHRFIEHLHLADSGSLNRSPAIKCKKKAHLFKLLLRAQSRGKQCGLSC